MILSIERLFTASPSRVDYAEESMERLAVIVDAKCIQV